MESAPGEEGGTLGLALVPGESLLLFTSEAGLGAYVPHSGATRSDARISGSYMSGP